MTKDIIITGLILIISGPVFAYAGSPSMAMVVSAGSSMPWWAWPIMLFAVTFVIGIVSVVGGVGGGVLFVPVVSGFFPFHLDFVRGAGLLVALTGALAAGPGLLKKGLASLRVAMPLALIASAGAIAGAVLGLALPRNIVQIGLGVIILVIALIMLRAKRFVHPEVEKPDAFSAVLGLAGVYHEETRSREVSWQARRTPQALAAFVLIGFMAGMFGLGAGWASVPVLNLMMGAPLKMAAATSSFLLSITAPSAAWIYINKGAVLPAIVAPSIIGMMLGARIGAALLPRTKPAVIRNIILCLLFLSGFRCLLKGFGV